jgi:hypothetical protein
MTMGSIVVCGDAPCPPFAVEDDPERVRVAVKDSGRDSHFPSREQISDMHGNGNIGSRKALEQSVGDHSLRASRGFFCRLANEHQYSVPALLAVSHDGRRAQQRCHVELVAARMHDGNVSPRVVLRTHFAGIGQPGLLLHGKSIELGAHITVGPLPFRRMATTPVPPTCSVTS